MLAWTYILTHDERRPVAGLTKGAASCVAQGSPARGASQRSRRLQVTQEGIEPAEDTLVEGAGAPWRLRRRRRRRPTMLLVLSISIGSKPRYCLYRVEGRSRRRARRVCNLSCTPRGARETSRMYGTLQIPSVIAEEKKNLQSAERESLLLEQERCEPADLTLQIPARSAAAI